MSFSRLPEDSMQFSLVVSDGEESVASATLTMDELQLVRALMSEARAFALTDEAVGTTEAVTTRFSDRDFHRVIVDVLKFGNQSSLFVNINTDNGEMTIEAGNTTRSDKMERGPFFEILRRIDGILGRKPSSMPH